MAEAALPSLTIVSPSFNQAEFVGATLQSVRAQGPCVSEHLIFDSCSTDGTVDILRQHAAEQGPRVRLTVEKDKGQADAINRGFRQASSDVIAWLNTDDVFAHDEVCKRALRVFSENPDADIVYGRGVFVHPDGSVLREAFINRDPAALHAAFINSVGILQPALFMRRAVFERFGPLDAQMSCAFDYEYWIRVTKGGAKWRFVDEVWAKALWHDTAKTNKTRHTSLAESVEACVRHYRFAPYEWCERLAGNEAAGGNFIFDSIASMSARDSERAITNARGQFAEHCAKNTAVSALLSKAHLREAGASLREWKRRVSRCHWDRIVVTSFDAAYFDQGLTLIASAHRHDAGDTPILVYDLGLSAAQRAQLAALRNVFVVDFPQELAGAFPEYLAPKSYVYKLLALHHAGFIADEDALVLWIDSGVSLASSLHDLFAIIAKLGVLLVDHDDRPIWPIENMSFTSDECIAALGASRHELAGGHLCSCLMGFDRTSRFAKMFAEAYEFSKIRAAALADKHPVPPIRIERTAGEAGATARRRAQEDRVYAESLSTKEFRALFGYYGHRQDQSIVSLLAARHAAPIQSAKAVCVGSDRSSEASKWNWESGSFSARIQPAGDAGEEFTPALTLHHRGTLRTFRGLDFGVRDSRVAVLVSDGRLVGEERLGGFAVFAVNADYARWDATGKYPSFIACLDENLGLLHKRDVARLISRANACGVERFLLRNNLIEALGEQGTSDRVHNLDLLLPGVPELAALPVTAGSHTLVWAAMLGFRQVCIQGADAIESDVANPSEGFQSWRAARQICNEWGVHIINADPALADLALKTTVFTASVLEATRTQASEDVAVLSPSLSKRRTSEENPGATPSRNGPGAAACVIIGNAPSMKSFDFGKLNGVATIGLYAAQPHWRQMGFTPTMCACIDAAIGIPHLKEIVAFAAEPNGPQTMLLSESVIKAAWPKLNAPHHVVNFEWLRAFAPALRHEPVTPGAHAAMWAILMGYRDVALIGMDDDDDEMTGDHIVAKSSRGSTAWSTVDVFAEANFARLWNCTPGSKLEVFERCDLSYFLSGQAMNVRHNGLRTKRA